MLIHQSVGSFSTSTVALLFYSATVIAYPTCDIPSNAPSADTSAARVLYWGLNNNQAQCAAGTTPTDALPITFSFELDPSAANANNFSFWNAATASWVPVSCAIWAPTSGVAPELNSVTLFLTSGLTPQAGDTLKVCHAPLPMNGGGTTSQGYITSQGWCDPASTPVAGQGIGIVDAFDNGNAGVCASPSSGIRMIFSGGARNSSVTNGWTLSDIQNRIRVTVNGVATPLSPVGLGDSDVPVPDNYYEICVNYPNGTSFADVANIQMDAATAYDPHGCANGGMSVWIP